jgi:hypothetical protein
MPTRTPRHTLIPNANNVRFLTRVLEFVARGVRDPKALAEVLDCELRTIHYYTQAGDWLGLLETNESKDPHLTRMGLEYVYAGKDRPKVYAEAIWSNAFVIDLMRGQDSLPQTPQIAEFIETSVPEMAPTTAKRRASAVRSLIQPAIKHRKKNLKTSHQMAFEFAPAYHPGGTITPVVDLRAGTNESPDVYRVVLRALLDHGELGTGHLRAVLDASGASDCGIGSYIEMAVRRGDARRVDDRLVVTWGAAWRRDVADTVVGVALSDPRYRAYLDCLRKAAAGDPKEAIRYSALRDRFAPWDRRVFGESIRPAQLSKDLDRILLGRPIDAFPLAEDAGKAPPLLEGAFLDLLQSDGLVLTFPPSLQLLLQGVNLINSHLERSNRTKNGVRMPEATDRRVVVHGGLFPPGLPLPKRIADGVTLRLLAVNNIPLVSLATALLLLDRRGGLPLSVHKGNNGPTVSHDGIPMGDLAQVLEGAAESQGWMVSRQTRADPNTLLSDVLVSLGIAHRLAHRLVLDEDFFVRLKHEPEDQEIANKLAWVEDLIQRYIEEMVAE